MHGQGVMEAVLYAVSNNLLSCMDEVRMVTGGLRLPYFLLVRVSVCVCQAESINIIAQFFFIRVAYFASNVTLYIE